MKAPLLIVAALSLPMAAHASLLDNISSKLTQKPAVSQSSTTEASSDLVGSVMSQLNLNQNQAEGGLGSLLTMAQSSLSSGDFNQITDVIPNANSLLAATPSVDKGAGLSGLLSKAGNVGSSMQGSAMVYDAFSKLGISKEMIAPMVDILKNYLQSQGGADTASLLTQGLGALL